MTRYGQVNRLKPGTYETYRKHHAAVWPEVAQMIAQCHIRNYTIYHHHGWLFASFEYHGTDFAADMAKMGAHPKTQEWWSIMDPLQDPVPTRREGEWWATMDECFHQD